MPCNRSYRLAFQHKASPEKFMVMEADCDSWQCDYCYERKRKLLITKMLGVTEKWFSVHRVNCTYQQLDGYRRVIGGSGCQYVWLKVGFDKIVLLTNKSSLPGAAKVSKLEEFFATLFSRLVLTFIEVHHSDGRVTQRVSNVSGMSQSLQKTKAVAQWVRKPYRLLRTKEFAEFTSMIKSSGGAIESAYRGRKTRAVVYADTALSVHGFGGVLTRLQKQLMTPYGGISDGVSSLSNTKREESFSTQPLDAFCPKCGEQVNELLLSTA